ncbi:hypothetical protein VKT23_015216 [Stygiomarasmius scandens]|uniref:Uncharacterized protein n=1 Tax=Marasmiellus scandens TaxID=2682957 RepID=A0ABR1J0V7_9AGAR
MNLRSRTIHTPYTDVSAPPAALPTRLRKRMVLDCVELPSASTRQSTNVVRPPGDEAPPEPSSATTVVRPVQGVPGLVQTVHKDGQVMMDFSQVRNRTWFDHDRARRQREAQERAKRGAKSPKATASSSRRQLTPVAAEVDAFPWDAREERINELHRLAESTGQRPPLLPPSSPPAPTPSPPPVEENLPPVSSPVRGKDVAFAGDIDTIEEEFQDDAASDNYSDDAHEDERLRKQRKARLARQRKRNQNRSKTTAQPGPKATSASLPAAKQPSKRGRKPKNPPVADAPDDEDDNTTPLLDPILDPDCPEYELEAEAYDTPGPLSNECRRELEVAAYEFETRLHELARKYQKSMGSLLQAAGYGFKTHRKDSTWNDFQAFQTKKNGEKPKSNETLQQFVARMSTEYKKIMKSELGDNWKNVDHRRELAKKLGWVGYAQQAREEMAIEERQSGVKVLTMRRCIDEFMKVAQMCYTVYGLILVGQLHDLNNHNRSKMFGWGLEYDRMLLSERTAFTKALKATAAKLRTCRDELEAGLEEDPAKSELLREYNTGPDKVAVLRPLLPKLFKLDMASATGGAVKNMKWKTFPSVAHIHQVRMIDYPKDLAVIGAKGKGLISHARDLDLPTLKDMIAPRMRCYTVQRKPQSTLTEDDRSILFGSYHGTRIVPWTEEEKALPLEQQGEVPLISDIDGYPLVTVKDVINATEEEEEGDSAAAKGKGKGKARLKETVQEDEDEEEEEEEIENEGEDEEEEEDDRLPPVEPEPEARESIYRTLPFSGRKIFTTPERERRLGLLGQAGTSPSHSALPRPQSIPHPQSIPRPKSLPRPKSIPRGPKNGPTFRPGPRLPSTAPASSPAAAKTTKRKDRAGDHEERIPKKQRK